tara:strand:- start:364 stop:1659 length:1296 start_codon:yes stop_codon:yes gene_type:complete
VKKVALIVDHPARDLDYISDIGLNLSKLGIKVYIVPSNMRHRELLLLSPDYVLYPNHRDTTTQEIRILNKINVDIGILETEQCVNENFYEEFQLPKKQISRTHIKDFFVWGEYFSNICVSRKWYGKNQIKVIGSPKHDRYFTQKEEKIKKEYDILLATSFPNSNPLHGEDVNRKMYKDLGMKISDIDSFIKLHKENSQNTVNFINEKLSNTELKVLLRIHPYEQNLEFYKKNIKGNNIKIDEGKDTIINSLNKSRILIHFNSTACIDSQAHNIPSINMSWMAQMKIFHESTEIMSLISYQPKTENECMQLVQEIMDNKTKLKVENNSDKIKKYIFNFDGSSSKRCAKMITLSLNSKTSDLNLHFNQKIFIKDFNLQSLIVSLILKYRWKKTRKHFDKFDIRNSLINTEPSIKLANPKKAGIDLTSVEFLEW